MQTLHLTFQVSLNNPGMIETFFSFFDFPIVASSPQIEDGSERRSGKDVIEMWVERRAGTHFSWARDAAKVCFR
jgi:hypothetical protein